MTNNRAKFLNLIDVLIDHFDDVTSVEEVQLKKLKQTCNCEHALVINHKGAKFIMVVSSFGVITGYGWRASSLSLDDNIEARVPILKTNMESYLSSMKNLAKLSKRGMTMADMFQP